ncbi:hypothetical protein Trydic_g22723 [Trypoxylus dichotomus]
MPLNIIDVSQIVVLIKDLVSAISEYRLAAEKKLADFILGLFIDDDYERIFFGKLIHRNLKINSSPETCSSILKQL